MRTIIKTIVNGSLRPFGVELRRIERPLSALQYINVFDLCAQDLLKRVTHPFVLQIGANDGVANDPVHDLIVDNELASLLIEPHPVAYASLKEAYEGMPFVQTRNYAVAEGDGIISFFGPSDDLASRLPRTHRLCSLDRDQVLKAFAGIGVGEPASQIKETKILAKSVRTLLAEEKLAKIDILQIDTEGFDWKILSQFNLLALDIQLINIELFALSRNDQNACISYLTSSGYKTSQFFGDLVGYKRAGLANLNGSISGVSA